jgi:hypothetical protein
MLLPMRRNDVPCEASGINAMTSGKAPAGRMHVEKARETKHRVLLLFKTTLNKVFGPL